MTVGDDEVEVVRDRRRDFGDTLVRIRVLRVPESETCHEGEGEDVEEIEFLGYEELPRRFARELPDEVSP